MGATAEFTPRLRLTPPPFDAADLVVAAPKEATGPAQTNPMIRFLPVVMAIATVAAMAVVFHSRSGVPRTPAFMLFPVMMLVSAAATVASGAGRRRGEIDAERTEYLRYLSGLRSVAVKNAVAQRDLLTWCHPDPDALWTLVGGCRMWERRSSDTDFGQVRIGVGTRPLAGRLVSPVIESAHRLDPVALGAMTRFVEAHSMVQEVPIAIDLRGVVTVVGAKPQTRAVVRAIICQLAVMHNPNSVLIAAVVTGSNGSDWDWLKWLPHNRHPIAHDDVGSVRMVYPTLATAKQALAGLAVDHVVVVVDAVEDITLVAFQRDGETVAGELRLQISGGIGATEVSTSEEVLGRPDQMSEVAALTCAQRLAGYRPGDADAATAGDVRWQDLVGIRDITSYPVVEYWNSRSPRERLRVPIGTTAEAAPVDLDIKESADNGMGPHGLCIGATGSGKSEFLRTVTLGMIARHSPEVLNLVLIDFKGGATFAGLAPVPHVAAVITNLSDTAALVSRTRDALTGEMNRRQETLRAAGNLDGIMAYERARRSRPELSRLPALFIIVDEFSELLSQHPDFADVFAAIGRLGRSLGMHLLLASQRLDEGRLRGLESHLSYRVCLKTLSASESRMVLGTPDAYELPGTPGAAYLRVGTEPLVRFQTAYVSGPDARETLRYLPAPQRVMEVRPFTTEPVGRVGSGIATVHPADRPTVVQSVVERLSGYGPRAHEVWLPPLGAAPALDVVLADTEPLDALTIPIGSVDRPFEQRRTPLVIDLSGAAGNVAVVGAPQSGKSTALRTLITALAVTHDPRMVQFYCLDFGGAALASMRDWPHVGAVAGRADTPLARRIIGRIHTIVRSREMLFREHGIESMVHYRGLKAERDPRCDRFGDVFLVVDGWAGLNRDAEIDDSAIAAIAAEGLSFGVHVVLSASRWAEIRPALRDQIGTRIELRLGDPADSELDRRRAHDVPKGQPGRGLSRDGLHMVVALPRLDGADSSSGLAEAGAQVGTMLRCRHSEWSAPPIALLPTRIDLDSLTERPDAGIVLGVEETELRPVAIDFAKQPHLLIIGDSDCGKTSTLRTVCRELMRSTNSGQCQLVIVDVRRSFLDVVKPESGLLGAYLASADAVGEAIPRLVEQLRRRMPPLNATVAQLRNRSWWSGPEIYVVIDDYELVAGAALANLADLLPHARDVGLHLVVARRSGGAARAMFEPLLAGLRDNGCLTLLMSGDPEEGLAIGSVRQSPLSAGRGSLIACRSSPQLMQVAWSPPP
ncbi:type VII secretion protein EccCa [Mycobacterium cookii]|uniref:type VII secretion protein EccCa n=1 Tax=Mycobacterium cookii TaxID=1775 RepID=UPI0038CC04AF